MSLWENTFHRGKVNSKRVFHAVRVPVFYLAPSEGTNQW